VHHAPKDILIAFSETMPVEVTTKTIAVKPTPTNCNYPTSAAVPGQCIIVSMVDLI